MGEFYDRKRKGLCTKCGYKPATGKRMILCDDCRAALHRQHEQDANPTKMYNPYDQV